MTDGIWQGGGRGSGFYVAAFVQANLGSARLSVDNTEVRLVPGFTISA
jgi:predicted kinase